jgi:hypothetical protein
MPELLLQLITTLGLDPRPLQGATDPSELIGQRASDRQAEVIELLEQAWLLRRERDSNPRRLAP